LLPLPVLNHPYKELMPFFLSALRGVLSALFIAAFVLGCASGPGTPAGQRKAQKNLEQGLCPSSIVYPGGRSQLGRERYSHEATDAELAAYRDREVTNCEQNLASGDVVALNVLLEYGYGQNDPQRIAAAYKAYLEKGSDVDELAKASATLYTMYEEGRPGLESDPAAAFHYLGLAAKYNPGAFELRYANALYSRGSYAAAFSSYEDLLKRESAESDLSKTDRCEINFKLGDMYFRGRGVSENWYIGYYYWLRGLSMAADPEWGSCDRGTYSDRDRYAIESERKRAIDRRLQRLGRGEIARVREAWLAPDKGLAYITSLTFRRPSLPDTDEDPESVSETYATGVAPPAPVESASWPPWAPLGGDICQWHTSSRTLNWSEVFQLRSGAIWSLKSNAGGAQSTGSAVAVSPTTLVTNCHLIKASSGVILLKEGSSMRAEVLAADPEGDRCILKSSEPLPTYVASARQQGALLVGEDVAAIGNPKGLDTSLSRGLVAQKRNKNGHGYIQTDAALSSGSSGGGLFDTAGNLVGVTTFKVSTGESLNFAIAIDEFCH
jgi:hypothetical protein